MFDVEHLVAHAFPNRRVAAHELLAGGLINTNFKVHFDGDFKPVVLRVYRDGPAACNKEVALHQLIHKDVPVAGMIFAHTEANDLPAFAVLEYVEALTFQQLKRTNDLEAIQQASASAGETLARIGTFQFSAPGELLVDHEELVVGEKFIDGPDPIPRLLDRFLSSPTLQQRAGAELIARLHDFIWSYASMLPDLEAERSLVHNDYGNRNILVREQSGKWRVAAILDWELAISGSPLLDVGHFLRYERFSQPLREPSFSRGFVEHGGHLPENWQLIVKLIDLTGLVECLTHENLPADVEAEVLELINSTLVIGTRSR